MIDQVDSAWHCFLNEKGYTNVNYAILMFILTILMLCCLEQYCRQ